MKRINGLLRRLSLAIDSKITYHEFAAIIAPVDLQHYLERIKDLTKASAADFSREA